MKDRIVISPTSRQEGHAELVMEVDDEGIVTKGRYLSITPVRGLEKMVAGKNPETAPVLCQRICGVCPIPHTLASVEAIDHSLDIEVPKAGKLLRQATLAAHGVNSAAIHHFLIAPAGEGIHPSDIRLGGMARNITSATKDKLIDRLKAFKPDMEKHVELMKSFIAARELPEGLGVVDAPLLASSASYGNLDEFDYDNFSEVLPEAWYDDPEIGKKACTTIPLINGKNVETGPRARMDKFNGFKDKGVVAQHVARAEEMLNNYNLTIDLLEQIDTSAPARADYDDRGTGKLGIGVIEGPRGTNVHMANVKDSKIQFYSAIVPTTWNIPTMGPATEGFHHKYGADVIRAYDPCLSCATHVMVVDDEDKSILKNDMVRI